jgi:hypothetical protein
MAGWVQLRDQQARRQSARRLVCLAGTPADIETLTRRVNELEQQILDLCAELAERHEDLTAARAANRELMAQVNL